MRASAVVLLVVVLGLAGTFGYTKYKERDLQAQARANVVRTHGVGGASFAVCKRPLSREAVWVRGIIARRYNDGAYARVVAYGPGSNGRPGRVYTEKWGNQWWGNVVTAIEVPVSINGWAEVSYASNTTRPIFEGYIPYC